MRGVICYGWYMSCYGQKEEEEEENTLEVCVMDTTTRTKRLLVAIIIALVLVVALQMVFLLGWHDDVHALFVQTKDTQAGPRQEQAERSNAEPEESEEDNREDDTRIEPWRPFSMRPFDPQTWDPFQEMKEMRKHIDSLFDDAFGRFGRSSRFGDLATDFSFDPSVDVKDENGRYVIRVDVPGADVTDLKASLEDNTLTISGTRKQEKEESRKGEYLRQERRIGTFQRSFPLPGPVVSDSLQTEYKDGVFTVTIDKAQASTSQ